MPDFTMGRRSMIYDRGRYKQLENRGSQSENKQDLYRQGVSRLLPKTGEIDTTRRQIPGISASRTYLTRRQQAEKQMRDRQMYEEERRRREAAERSGAEPLAQIRKRYAPLTSRLQKRRVA